MLKVDVRVMEVVLTQLRFQHARLRLSWANAKFVLSQVQPSTYLVVVFFVSNVLIQVFYQGIHVYVQRRDCNSSGHMHTGLAQPAFRDTKGVKICT